MRILKLMADYNCFPLWESSDDALANVDPMTLPISENLIFRLNDWAARFDGTLNVGDPVSSGFQSEALEQAFLDEGRNLCQALQVELGDEYLVTYGGA